MQGLELSRRFWRECGEPMLKEQFPELLPKLAAGLCGSGSECFGFDDEISQDHDFEPGFCLFLPEEEILDRKAEFALERAYGKLPKEFEGFMRSVLAPVGGARRGVIRAADFWNEKVGSPDGVLTLMQWLKIPDFRLAEATNGEIFHDGPKRFTEVRNSLLEMPSDVRLKRLAGNLLLMAQSGQYNFMRCIRHGEPAAAQLAAGEFVNAAIRVIFLLNRRYAPYYKWAFRALRTLPRLSAQADYLEYLLTGSNDGDLAEEKYFVIEQVASDVIEELQAQEITKANCGDLEKHAYSVNDFIEEADVRNLNILAAV